jgi:hypothetical protein
MDEKIKRKSEECDGDKNSLSSFTTVATSFSINLPTSMHSRALKISATQPFRVNQKMHVVGVEGATR